MIIIKQADAFSQWRKKESLSVGFVPTMGALHSGHMSLIKKSIAMCHKTVVSIFLNPTQFGPNEDLGSYPKTIESDIHLLRDAGADVLFLPNEKEMYSRVESVRVPESPLFKKLEGKSRPHFFFGVTTIVAKLLNVINPSHAFFGKKDAQQLIIVRQMIQKMQYSIKVVPVETKRDDNGLALSSRNQYLNNSQQKEASLVFQGLTKIKKNIINGEKNCRALKKIFVEFISKNKNFNIDYISIADMETLEELIEVPPKHYLVSTAIFFNKVRLIDNFDYSQLDT